MDERHRERYEKALISPSEAYETPEHVLADEELSDAQKIDVLRRWWDIQRSLMRASGEGMPDDTDTQMQEVVDALLKLGVDAGDTG